MELESLKKYGILTEEEAAQLTARHKWTEQMSRKFNNSLAEKHQEYVNECLAVSNTESRMIERVSEITGSELFRGAGNNSRYSGRLEAVIKELRETGGCVFKSEEAWEKAAEDLSKIVREYEQETSAFVSELKRTLEPAVWERYRGWFERVEFFNVLEE